MHVAVFCFWLNAFVISTTNLRIWTVELSFSSNPNWQRSSTCFLQLFLKCSLYRFRDGAFLLHVFWHFTGGAFIPMFVLVKLMLNISGRLVVWLQTLKLSNNKSFVEYIFEFIHLKAKMISTFCFDIFFLFSWAVTIDDGNVGDQVPNEGGNGVSYLWMSGIAVSESARFRNLCSFLWCTLSFSNSQQPTS